MGSVTSFPENRKFRTQYALDTITGMSQTYEHCRSPRREKADFLPMTKTKTYFSILRPRLKILQMVGFLIAGHTMYRPL